MAVSFTVAVFDYDVLVLFTQTESDKIPNIGEEVGIDFNNTNTIFIEGAWGEDATMGGVSSFTIHGPSQAVKEYGRLPVVECQLAYDDLL